MKKYQNKTWSELRRRGLDYGTKGDKLSVLEDVEYRKDKLGSML